MNTPRLLSVLRFALTLGFVASLLSQASAANTPPPVAKPNVISVDFPGGTIAEFVALVAKSGGSSFNLIGEKVDFACPLPPFSVRDADIAAVANALNILLASKGLAIIPTSGGAGGVYALMKGNAPVPTAGRDPVLFDTFQLAPFLANQSVDDIVDAIRGAWELNPANKADALKIKYHPQTTLLLVSGSQAAINVASKVIDNLKRVPPEVVQKLIPKPDTPKPAADKK
jgi:hypothetical protein